MLIGLGLVVSKAVWLLPWIVLVPIILTYTIDSPLVYLVLLASYAELYSVAQPGMASVIIFLPYLMKKLWSGLIDVSATFIGMVGLTIFVQAVALFIPDIFRAHSVGVMPWSGIGPMIGLTTLTAFLTIIAVHYNRTW